MKLILNGRFLFIGALFLMLTVFSCKESDIHQRKRDTIGQIDDVIFVVQTDLWNTALKDTVQYYFESPYLLLPQPEPVFRLNHFSMHEILTRPIRKKFATMVIIANMSDSLNSPEARMALKDLGPKRVNEILTNPKVNFATVKGKWADDQIIIYVLGNSQEELERAIVQGFPKIAAKVRLNDKPRITNRVYHTGRNSKAEKMLKDTFGISMQIPNAYVTSKIRSKKLIWIRKETPNLSSNILVASFPYRDKKQINPDTLQNYLNIIGKEITSSTEGSYFVINDHDLPLIKSVINLNEHYAVENRGIWELENDFMGGPFLSYLLQNPAKQGELILIAGFVYAPEKQKKGFVEDLEEVLRSWGE